MLNRMGGRELEMGIGHWEVVVNVVDWFFGLEVADRAKVCVHGKDLAVVEDPVCKVEREGGQETEHGHKYELDE